MAASDELVVFVRDALARGQSRAQIADVLVEAGWTNEQTQAALRAFADVDFPVPVPRARPYLSAREAFIYLVLFATLYTSAYSLGSLLFDVINLQLPDPADGTNFYGGPQQIRDSIRWSIAALVIAFPVFVYLAQLTSRAMQRDPTKRASKIRRWLTYLTLFVSAAVVLGDATTLVYNLLGGEATLRFLLKVTVVALIAGTAFTYYLRDLRTDEVDIRMSAPRGRALLVAVSVVIALAVVTGAVAIGSPAEARARRMDQKRVDDLRRIAPAVLSRYNASARLPASLNEIENDINIDVRDPATSEPYGYHVIDERRYELCATFERESDDSGRFSQRDDFGAHRAGRRCFTLTVPEASK